MEKFENKIYGTMGLRAKFANWNADFTGFPKKIDGQIFASDKALKFVIRRFLESKGKKVFYTKTYDKEGKVNSYSKRYQTLFNISDADRQKEIKDVKKVIKNILTCQDIRFFGTITTLKGGNSDNESAANIGIRGPIQITHGINKDKKTKTFTEEIISQFSSTDEKSHNTIGGITLVNEAHYFYGFNVNPNIWYEFDEIFKEIQQENGEDFIPYITEEDIKLFKESILHAVDDFNSTTKAGCNNEFALFVTTENDMYLPDLNQYIEFDSNNKSIVFNNLADYFKLLKEEKPNAFEKIKSVEIFVRPKYAALDKSINKVKELFGDKISIKEF